MIAPQHSTQDGPPDDLLAKLRKRLDYQCQEITRESAIDPAVALERGYYLEEAKRGLERLGFTRRQQRAPAIVIPRFSPSGERIPPQIKPDKPLIEEKPNGKSRPRKYETPAGTPVRLSVPPRAVPMMRDARKTLYITEGDKKADALASVGECCIALQGVQCWRVLEDWEGVKLYGREVVIAFDADVMVNPNVQKALQVLAAFLRERGALVKYLLWPERYRGTKTGIDDYLAAGGKIQELQSWLAEHPNEDDLPVGTLLSEVEEEKIAWLWERRIPYRKLTMLDGDPAHGKSVIVAELAARVTTGRGMPLHTGKVEAGGVLLLAAEDGVADTILPRIVAAGGDPSRVLVLGHDTPLWIPEDMHTVERGAERIGAKLIAVDPIMSFLGAGINSNTDKEVRTALSPLKHLAERIGAAVLIVRHLNKQQGGSAMYRGAGSIAFSGAARQGLMVDDHPREEGMKVLVGYKSNLSLPPDTMKYKVVSAPSNPDVAAVEFHGIDTEVSSGDIARSKPGTEDRSAMAEAIDFLREILAGGPVATKKVEKEAEDAGHSWATVKRAKDALKVKSEKDGTAWMWRLPEDPDDDSGDGGNRAGASVRQCDTPIDEHLEHLQETGVATDGCVGKVLIDEHLEHLPPTTPNNNNNGGKEAYLSEGAQGAQDAHD